MRLNGCEEVPGNNLMGAGCTPECIKGDINSTDVTIDEERNQSFIMECTSCERRVTLLDARGKKFQTQKG